MVGESTPYVSSGGSDILFGVVPEVVQFALGVAPVLVDLDKDLEEDFLVEELLQGLARLAAYLLERHALMPDYDAFL